VTLKHGAHWPVRLEELACAITMEAANSNSTRATKVEIHIHGDVRVTLGLEEVRPFETGVVVGEDDGIPFAASSVVCTRVEYVEADYVARRTRSRHMVGRVDAMRLAADARVARFSRNGFVGAAPGSWSVAGGGRSVLKCPCVAVAEAVVERVTVDI
jgi:hypothetical protein